MRALYKNSLVFLLLLATVMVTYWPARHAMPKNDHITFMEQRNVIHDDAKFLEVAFFYSRLRTIGMGDYFLFRPLTTGLIGVLDIAFRENLLLVGLLSFFWHTILVFILYLILLKIGLPFFLSVSFAVLSAVQYPGMELVLWRHISPYLLGLICFLAALYPTDKKILPALLLFLSCLFHELSVIFCAAMFAFCFLTRQRDRALIFLAPLLAYFVFDAWDFWAHTPPTFFGPADKGMILSPELIFRAFFMVVGMQLYAWLLPWRIVFDFHPPSYLFLWSVFRIHATTYVVMGIVAIVGFVFLHRSLIKAFQKKDNKAAFWVYTCGLIYLFCLFFGFSYGRGVQRGKQYYQDSPYYIYFASLCFTLVLGSILTLFKRRSNILGVYVLILAVLNFYKIRTLIGPHEAFEKNYAQLVSEGTKFLKSSDCCLDKISKDLKEYQLDFFYGLEICKFKKRACQVDLVGKNEAVVFVGKKGDEAFSTHAKLLPYPTN